MKGFEQDPTSRRAPLPFAKMAGAGNDFVVIDNRSGAVADAGDLTRRICTRRLSVGADGLILLESSARATVRMRYYNADGGEADFCANGTRCAARFAVLSGMAPPLLTLETGAGIVGAEVGENGVVTLALQPPGAFDAERPLRVGEKSVRGSSVVVGVPHYVLFHEGDLWQDDIAPLGSAIRNHPALQPEGANVNFVVVRGKHAIEVRTYERGVEGETLACGSGVVASVATSAIFGKVESPVAVRTRSGITLDVSFDRDGTAFSNVRLAGDARLVYRAELTPETVEGFDPEFVRDPTARVEVP
jgi:diaminopimelate epimerase